MKRNRDPHSIQTKYKQDFRSSNPALHSHYVISHITHILAIDQAIKNLNELSNLTVNEMILGMFNQRAKLIRENAAFAAAIEHLEYLARKKLIHKCGDLFIGFHNPEGLE